ncbi:MAG: hypothetical protein ACXVQ3_07025 [Gaiellaceae bacterium]
MSDRPEPALVPLRPLPLMERRAVGGPVPAGLLAAYAGAALAAWLAAAVALLFAADDLARGAPFAPSVLLVVHLAAAAALSLGVAGASFHLLPVMLRNDLPSIRALWAALPLLVGGAAVAAGLARWSHALVWIGAAAVAGGLAIVVFELGTLVVRAPGDRTLIASRAGVALALGHAAAALVAGALIFDLHRSFWGVGYERWLLVHLHLALLGWIALLIVTVGRNLAPMLAQAPAAPKRRLPFDELVLVAALWVLIVGIAADDRVVTLVGGAFVVGTLARFGSLLVRVSRSKHAPLDAPLGHLLAGAVFLLQAAVLGVVSAAGGGGVRVVEAYVVFLLLGWAGGVVVGHLGKLLSLSLWVWWPPGPRPKQAELYPRRLAVAETATFAVGVEAVALAVLTGQSAAARCGAVLVCISAVLAAATAAATWRRRAT